MKALENEKYILLETIRKNNTPVATPVWFVIANDLIYVVTRDQTGKIKRLKNNKNVRLASCTMRGNQTEEWHSGTASFATEQETKDAIKLRRKKYGFLEKIAQFASKSKGELIVFSVSLQNESQE